MRALDRLPRRELVIRNRPYVIEVTAAGVQLREKGRRYQLMLPWSTALAAAERLAGEERAANDHRRRLRLRAVAP